LVIKKLIINRLQICEVFKTSQIKIKGLWFLKNEKAGLLPGYILT